MTLRAMIRSAIMERSIDDVNYVSASAFHILAFVVAIGSFACSEPSKPSNQTPEPIPAPSSPDNLIRAIEILYNDTLRTSAERLVAYQDLFVPIGHSSLPPFEFRFGTTGTNSPPVTWKLATELDSHQNLFGAQETSGIRFLVLQISHNPATNLDQPEPGQEEWKQVFTSSISLRVVLGDGDDDELTVIVPGTRFIMAPDGGRWYIVEWYETPPSSLDLTWGGLKATFLTNSLPQAHGYQVDDWSAWSPDDGTIVYHRNVPSSAGPPGVYGIDPEGTNNRLLVEGTWFEPRHLRFAPNGRDLAVIINFEIFVVDVSSGGIRQLTETNGHVQDLDWSPDGNQIIYQRSLPPTSTPSFFILNVDTGKERGLFNNGRPVQGGQPRWSPLGDAIAFASGSGSGAVDVFTIHPSGKNLRRVTSSVFDRSMAQDPRWAFGGRYIFYSWRSQYDAATETRMMRADGDSMTTWPVTIRYFDSLSPDSEHLIYAGAQDDSTWVLFIRDIDDEFGITAHQLTSYEPSSGNVERALRGKMKRHGGHKWHDFGFF